MGDLTILVWDALPAFFLISFQARFHTFALIISLNIVFNYFDVDIVTINNNSHCIWVNFAFHALLYSKTSLFSVPFSYAIAPFDEELISSHLSRHRRIRRFGKLCTLKKMLHKIHPSSWIDRTHKVKLTIPNYNSILPLNKISCCNTSRSNPCVKCSLYVITWVVRGWCRWRNTNTSVQMIHHGKQRPCCKWSSSCKQTLNGTLRAGLKCFVYYSGLENSCCYIIV